DRLIQKLQVAEQKLEELIAKQERLQEKSKDVGRVADATQRKSILERLAREQQELQSRGEELVRELNRLRAERASQSLSQAASRMQQAGRQMDEGDDAGEQHQEALDRLNDSQAELKQARKDSEEELAREKLAKLSDQIKGLKERQESLLMERQRIDRE